MRFQNYENLWEPNKNSQETGTKVKSLAVDHLVATSISTILDHIHLHNAQAKSGFLDWVRLCT